MHREFKFNPLNVTIMVRIGNLVLVPLDGSVSVSFTRGGSVCVDDEVILGRYSFEAGHPQCNQQGMCIAVRMA